jgi:hypothetical protein
VGIAAAAATTFLNCHADSSSGNRHRRWARIFHGKTPTSLNLHYKERLLVYTCTIRRRKL